MEQKYLPLFEPISIGRLKLKNRIVMSPMTTRLSDAGHGVSERMIDYFAARARGGAGMVTTEAFYVAQRFGGNNTVNLDSNEKIPGIAALADAVHAWDCKLCVQLGCGLGRYDAFGRNGEPPKTSSAIPSFAKPDISCVEMSVEEIAKVVKEYAKAAQRAAKAGADAINIHGHNGYLIDQFMSAQFNTRTDQYGGSLENRMRYAVEIITAVKKAVGPNIPLIFRFSADLKFRGSRGMEESVSMLKVLQEAGVDALDLDTGATESMDWIFIPYYWGEGCALYVAKEARKGGITIPILNSGCHNPDTAIDALASGAVDCVMFGRSLIADPELPNKLQAGRAAEVRPCMRCNQYCTKHSISTNSYTSCAGNAAAGNEARFALAPGGMPKVVAVVGGGPAGMEAARVAALRGHKVTLYEKEQALGGMSRHYASHPFRPQAAAFLRWQRQELDRLGVQVVLGRELVADSPELESANAILVAVGTRAVPPAIPGIEHAVSIRDVDPATLAGKEVLIAGGALSGCELAVALADGGNQVTVVERQKRLAGDSYGINRTALQQIMRDRCVVQMPLCEVVEIFPDGVQVRNAEGAEQHIPADVVIHALGSQPLSDQVEAILSAHGRKITAVGTCRTQGDIGSAVRDAYFAANRI